MAQQGWHDADTAIRYGGNHQIVSVAWQYSGLENQISVSTPGESKIGDVRTKAYFSGFPVCTGSWLPLMTGDFRKNLGYTRTQSIPEDLDANRKEDEGGEPH